MTWTVTKKELMKATKIEMMRRKVTKKEQIQRNGNSVWKEKIPMKTIILILTIRLTLIMKRPLLRKKEILLKMRKELLMKMHLSRKYDQIPMRIIRLPTLLD